MLVDSNTKTFSGESQAHSQTVRFWGKKQFKVILFITCSKKNFLCTKKSGRHCPRMRRRGCGLGRSKAFKWLSKSRDVVAFLTQNITNFLFYQGRRNSDRSGGAVEKFMAMEIYFKKNKKIVTNMLASVQSKC